MAHPEASRSDAEQAQYLPFKPGAYVIVSQNVYHAALVGRVQEVSPHGEVTFEYLKRGGRVFDRLQVATGTCSLPRPHFNHREVAVVAAEELVHMHICKSIQRNLEAHRQTFPDFADEIDADMAQLKTFIPALFTPVAVR